MNKSLYNIGHIFHITGAVWGASFTIEKNISKFWGKSSKCILIIKIILSVLFNGLFIILKYYLNKINDIELNFILNILINFLQNFLTFGIIPLILEKFGLIENERKFKRFDETKNLNIEDEQIIFRTSIYKEEKEKPDEGFIVLDKKPKNIESIDEKDEIKKDKGEENKLIQGEASEENEFIWEKNKEGKDEIYGHSNLVENVQNVEEEEEEYLYLEGIEEEQK